MSTRNAPRYRTTGTGGVEEEMDSNLPDLRFSRGEWLGFSALVNAHFRIDIRPRV
jgi:hypothetical protein